MERVIIMAYNTLLSTPPLLAKYISKVFPLVDKELAFWQKKLANCPDSTLKKNALASLESKRFHALGGSVFALYYKKDMKKLVRFITALQTISDYLDNLCDRAGVLDEVPFRKLHDAMLDAVTLRTTIKDYYSHYPYKEDGGYLKDLVLTCRETLNEFPSYTLVEKDVLNLVSLYCDLQVYKHIQHKERVQRLCGWFDDHCNSNELDWWEFSAACGSTLGIFALAAAACEPNLAQGEINKIKDRYFPWICGLHILLDYYIDQEEDEKENDLNFVSFYSAKEISLERISYFYKKAQENAASLHQSYFHITVVQGLLAMYLSDIKVKNQGLEVETQTLLQKGGRDVKILYYLCCWLRRKKIL